MSFEESLFEEMRRIDLLWKIVEIGQVCFECLMFMNFVALIHCAKHALFSFSMKLY
jgi:hypothetical protein